jgi:cytochrome b561
MTRLSPPSFREKSAWISLVSIVLVFGTYFSYVGMVLAGLARNRVALFPVMVGVFIVAEIVLHVVIATQSPRDARTPKDERERLIELKAVHAAFYVLLVGAFGSIGTVHVRLSDSGDHLWLMMQAILFSIVLAEAVKFARQVVLYRRDA